MKQSLARDGGRILVDQLAIHGVDHLFCVPGESYLAALNALHDSDISVTVCRQEGGAAMMAEASGKLTGRPGICFVTRGPGATNASPGIHIAKQDSTPMILFVGQVERGMKGREAFQEVDYAAAFGPIAKWATEIDDTRRIPEIVARAFHVATNGRPGPVVIGLPEDMLTEVAVVADAKPYKVSEPVPAEHEIEQVRDILAAAERPLVIAGGTRWDATAVNNLVRLAEEFSLPVAVSFRRQSLFPADHKNFVGDLGVGSNPELVEYARSSDAVILLGGRLSELPSQSYSLFSIPAPSPKLVHVHPGAEELGRVYQFDIGLNTSPGPFLKSLLANQGKQKDRQALIGEMNRTFKAWTTPRCRKDSKIDLGEIMNELNARMPPSTVIANGAGNYATWVHRFYRFTKFGTQLAPTSGSMGYGIPAAVAAARLDLSRPVIAFAGDGCFLMNGQEFATAVQYDLAIIVIVVDNGMYGTIRMHQEMNYPDRVVATSLKNPDFAAYARAFGGHGERVEKTEDFVPALERAVSSGRPAIIHCLVSPDTLTIDRSLTVIRETAKSKLAVQSH
ncbi:thiamine pyrophosphate-binding protein [Pelagibacterium sp.]|uniref:thiamine pyrophosphate-binding protein n=1 Tax=Pelagibacterium sp. TaxID=1967288 RepID=UPI003C7C4334